MTNVSLIFYALLGGILPALIWLAFWLREDRKHPEPKGLIMRTFLFGMLTVPIVLPFQKAIDTWLPGMVIGAIFLWAVLEEIFTFAAAYFGGLKTVADDEPVDPIIYMITAALGFVALENTLFILGPLFNGESIVVSIINGNLRFIGASLLHVVSSGIIGVAFALTFYKSRRKRLSAVSMAIGLAVALHTLFNLIIIRWDNPGTILSFGLVWIGIIFLLLAFEKVKTIAR